MQLPSEVLRPLFMLSSPSLRSLSLCPTVRSDWYYLTTSVLLVSSVLSQSVQFASYLQFGSLKESLHVVFEDLGVWLLKHLTHFLCDFR